VTRVGASEWSRGHASDIDGQTERSKWAGAHESVWAASKFQLKRMSRANGMNETEGKAAMVVATERGKRRSFNKE
jgi:hypothetical protein